MSEYIPLFQTVIWAILIFAAFRYLKSDLERLRDGLAKRLESGSPVKVGPIELGELKNEIKEIKSEVRDTKKVVRDEVKIINDRFNKLTQTSRDFLQLRPLSETWDAIDKIKTSLEKEPLSSEEIDKSLASFDPKERVPGYLELQIRPQQDRLESILDCLYL